MYISDMVYTVAACPPPPYPQILATPLVTSYHFRNSYMFSFPANHQTSPGCYLPTSMTSPQRSIMGSLQESNIHTKEPRCLDFYGNAWSRSGQGHYPVLCLVQEREDGAILAGKYPPKIRDGSIPNKMVGPNNPILDGARRRGMATQVELDGGVLARARWRR